MKPTGGIIVAHTVRAYPGILVSVSWIDYKCCYCPWFKWDTTVTMADLWEEPAPHPIIAKYLRPEKRKIFWAPTLIHRPKGWKMLGVPSCKEVWIRHLLILCRLLVCPVCSQAVLTIIDWYSFILLVGQRHSESKAPGAQHNNSNQARNFIV